MSRDIEKVLLPRYIRKEYDLQQLTKIKLKMPGQSFPLCRDFSRVWDLCFGTTEIFIGKGGVGFPCAALVEGCEKGRLRGKTTAPCAQHSCLVVSASCVCFSTEDPSSKLKRLQ